jgi:hypothetical protein
MRRILTLMVSAGAVLTGSALTVAHDHAAVAEEPMAVPKALTRFTPSILAGPTASAAVPGGSPATLEAVQRPVLLAGDGTVEAVWNTGRDGTAPGGYLVRLYRVSCQQRGCPSGAAAVQRSAPVAAQAVCGTCTWASFAAPDVGNGETYQATVTAVSGSRSSAAAATGPARPSQPETDGPQQAELQDEAEQIAGQAAGGEDAGVAIDYVSGRVMAGYRDTAHYPAHVAALARTAHPQLVVPRRMIYSTQTLTDLTERIVDDRTQLAGEGVHVTGAFVDSRADKVLVYADSVSTQAQAILAARYGADKVMLTARQVQVRRASNNPEWHRAPRGPLPDNTSWYGGIVLINDAGVHCTAGYVTFKGRSLYLLTAGHCFDKGDIIHDLYNTAVGYVASRQSGHNTRLDVETIKITFPRMATNQIIATRGTVWRNVTDDADRFVSGTRVCFSGAVSGSEKCAFNDAQGAGIWPDGSVVRHVTSALESSVATKDFVKGGDSGSPVYRSLSRHELRVYGIVDGSFWTEDQNGDPLDGGFIYTFDADIRRDFRTAALQVPIP